VLPSLIQTILSALELRQVMRRNEPALVGFTTDREFACAYRAPASPCPEGIYTIYFYL